MNNYDSMRPHGEEKTEGELNNSDESEQGNTPTEELSVGGELTGLRLSDELKEGEKYWDQVIPSPYGDLVYMQPQFRNGQIIWRTRDKKVAISVESGSKTIVGIYKE